LTFVSVQYVAFFLTVLFIYWRLSHRHQIWLLLVASYGFYAAWDWRFCFLMALTTVVDFFVGIGLERTSDQRARKRLFGLSVGLNLTVLGFFKYFDFFSHSAVQLFNHFGWHLDEPTLNILLPIGISFYTFHGISYTFDVFRRQLEPTHSFPTFAAFVAFFPQLVSGPIGRAHIQLPQLANPRVRPSRETVASAVSLILLGFFKKIVIADALAPYVTQTFETAGHEGAVQLILGTYAFALQIYGDFCGYTDIARGSARLLGVELPLNFRQPYLSTSITEFWRNWHISLSNWLRDYLYVPLGGNRGAAWKTGRNLMLTMLIGGLWHGAAWTFVVWGGLHGLMLTVERFLIHPKVIPDRRFRWRDIPAMFITFHLVCAAWIFFRATSFTQAFQYVGGIVTLRTGPIDGPTLAAVALAAALSFALDLAQRNGRRENPVQGLSPPAQGAVVGVLLLGIVIFSGEAGSPFIYFRF
jgi:alginate O-acetyltransferase complex protein AlgI